MEEDGIQHRTLRINGINMHIAEKGNVNSEVVLFIHGFPELWYSWRHQIHSLSSLGYRAVAPDLRGFGDTDAPADAREYTYFHIVGDLVALLDALGVGEAFVVGHGIGAMIAWWLCVLRPEKVKALVNLSVAFPRRNPKVKPVEMMRAAYGDDHYICRFQEPGEIEAEIAQSDGMEKLLRKLFANRYPGPLLLPKGQSFNAKVPLPRWLSEEEIAYYSRKFNHKGITGGLNHYRTFNFNWELTAPWTGARVMVPVKFMIGDLDLTYHVPRVKEYIRGGGMERYVPFLQEVVVLQGVGHFLQQEKAEVVSKHIYEFFQKFSNSVNGRLPSLLWNGGDFTIFKRRVQGGGSNYRYLNKPQWYL